MERQESSIFSRVQARALERERKRQEAEAEEMKWHQGDIIAIKEREFGFTLVRVEENVDSGHVASGSPFKALVFNKRRNGNWIPTEQVVDVDPKNVLRPVKLDYEHMLPSSTFAWLVEHHPPELLRDSSDDSTSADDDSEEDSDADEEDAASGEDEDNSDEDGEDDSPPGKKKPAAKRAKATRAPKSPKAPKAGKAKREPKPPKEKKVKVPKPKKVKVPKEKKVKVSKKPKKPPPPPYVPEDELYAASSSDELDPCSHKEALRAAVTNNATVFKKVLESSSHRPWLFAATGPNLANRAPLVSPLIIILRKADPAMLKVLVDFVCPPKPKEKAAAEGDDASKKRQAFMSIFKEQEQDHNAGGFGYHHHQQYLMPFGDDSLVKPWGTSVAQLGSSLLLKQSSGQASFRMMGRHVRNVNAGRGGRELGNAFMKNTDSLGGQFHRDYLALIEYFFTHDHSGKSIAEMEAVLQKLWDAVIPNLKTHDPDLPTVQPLKFRMAPAFVTRGHYNLTIEALRNHVGAEKGHDTGPLHILALDPASNDLPPKTLAISINKKGINGATPLHYACVNPNPSVLKAMLAVLGHGSAPLGDYQSRFPLHYAVANENPEAVKILMDHGVTLTANDRKPAVHVACELNRHAALQQLLTKDAPVQLGVTAKNVQPALIVAASHDATECVEVILTCAHLAADKKQRLKILKQNHDGMTALHIAAFHGNVKMIQVLLANGAPIESKDRQKRTPLFFAAIAGSVPAFSFLCSKGAKFAIADSSANAPIHYAAAYGHPELLKYIVEQCHGDINAETAWKMTPIGLALLSGYASTCGKYLLDVNKKLLEEQKASQQQKDDDDAGADDNDDGGEDDDDDDDAGPKKKKAAPPASAVAPVKPIDLNFRDDKYNTMLHTVLSKNYGDRLPELVQHVTYLLKLGCDATLKSADGRNLLHILAFLKDGAQRRQQLENYLAALKWKLGDISVKSDNKSSIDQLAEAVLNKGSSPAKAPKMHDGDDDEDEDDGNDEDDEDEDEEDDDDAPVKKKAAPKMIPRKAMKCPRKAAAFSFGGPPPGKGGSFGAPNFGAPVVAAPMFGGFGHQNHNGNNNNGNPRPQAFYQLPWPWRSQLERDDITKDEVTKEIETVEKQLSFPDVEIILCDLIIKNVSDEHKKVLFETLDSEGNGPLLTALLQSNFGLVKRLLELGSDPTVADKTGKNVLHHVLTSATPAAIEKIDINLCGAANIPRLLSQLDHDGLSPLHRFLLVVRDNLPSVAGNAPARATYIAAVRKLLKVMLAAGSAGAGKKCPAHVALAAGPFTIADDNLRESATNQKPNIPKLNGNSRPIDAAQNASIGIKDFPHQAPKDLPARPLLARNTHHWFGGYSLAHFAVVCVCQTNQSQGAQEAMALLQDVLDADKGLVHAKDINSRAPLHQACRMGRLDIVNALLKAGAKANDECDHGLTPLLIATSLRSTELAKVLVAAGADVNAVDELKRSAMHRMACHRDADLFELLLAKKADVKAKDAKGRTILHYCLSFARTQSFQNFNFEKTLIDKGVDPHDVDSAKRSALHYCFTDLEGKPSGDPIETLGSLLARLDVKRAINMADEDGNTPIHLALLCRSLSCALLLARRGADVNAMNNDGNCPLALTLLGGAVDAAITFLQLDNANVKVNPDVTVNEVRYEGAGEKRKKIVTTESACGYAMKKGFNGVIYMMLEAGLPVRRAMIDGLKHNLAQLCENLLDKVPPAELQAKFGGKEAVTEKTVLHYLAASGSCFKPVLFDAFRSQVKCGVNDRDAKGWTPAHYAHGNASILRALRGAGADLSVKDKEGLTPLTPVLDSRPLSPQQIEVLKSLFAQKATPDFNVVLNVGPEPPRRVVPAVVASLLANDMQTLVALIKADASLTGQDSNGRTLLMHAITERHNEAAKILIRCPSIAINAQDKDGNTALHHAVLSNATELVEEIIKHAKPNVNAQNGDGNTPLHLAVQPLPFGSYENAAILTALINAKADPKIKNNDGATAPNLTTAQTSGRLQEAFKKLKVPTPEPMSRHGSIIPTAQWSKAHGEVDAEADAAKLIEASASATVDDHEPKVDEVYFSTKDKSARHITKVHDKHDLVMTKVDSQYGMYGLNMFYRMQVLHDTMRDVYILWTRWGRVGEQGQYQATPFGAASTAVGEFRSIFKSKSGNDWDHRADFAKMKKKYQYHPILYKTIKAEDIIKPFTEAELNAHPTPMQDRVRDFLLELSDVTTLTQCYKLTGIDKERFPLGRLPREILVKALDIVNEMRRVFTQPEPSQEKGFLQMQEFKQEKFDKLAQLANDYYELVPHADFAYDRIAPPNSEEAISELWNRVASMKDLERSSQLLLGARANVAKMDPLQYIQNAIAVDIGHIDPQNEAAEFNALKQYINRSSSHNRIHAIFRIQRRGEGERLQSFCGNDEKLQRTRKLLFHGSSSSNMLSILSQGLKPAPMEAPKSGHMLGKGIYFADVAAKSLGYCRDRTADGSQFMLLCEVALGTTYALKEPKYVEKLPPGTHSVHALGSTQPDPSGDVILNNGICAPMGPLIQRDHRTQQPEGNYHLGHSEYVVFDPSQVRMRYLIQFRAEHVDKAERALGGAGGLKRAREEDDEEHEEEEEDDEDNDNDEDDDDEDVDDDEDDE